jgi:hypothetical protein
VSVRNHKNSSSTDAKVEAERKIIRTSLDEITAEVQHELRCANTHASISIVVPSRYALATIVSLDDVPSHEWSRMSAIVREIVGKRLGKTGLRAKPLAHSMAIATVETADTPPI